MFDPTKPVQTRDGRKARIVCTDNIHHKFPIVGLITERCGEEVPNLFMSSGRYHNEDEESRNDLINIPEKHVRYLNIYEDGLYSTPFEFKEDADRCSGSNRTGRIRIEYEDGQFDD